MFGFIKRLFGSEPAGRPDRPASPVPSPVAARPAAPAVVLQRDEIIDAATRIAGYRFSARRVDPAEGIDAVATHEVLLASNIAALAERRFALIPISADDWQRLDYRPLIAARTVFALSPPEHPEKLAEWQATADAIHACGAGIALDSTSLDALGDAASRYADYVLLDFSAASLANFEQAIRTLRTKHPQAKLIADRVNRWPEHRYCLANDIAYCLGAFSTAADEEQQNGEIDQSRLVLIEMLNGLRQETELEDLAQIAKRDPGVVVKVIAMANSPLLGLPQTVTSIDQAIMVLGRQQLYRWLSIGMFRAGSASPRDEVLLELALARGRFLELLGQEKFAKAECDELFLLGLLSLLDSLLGLPMAQVVERIHLTPALREVLLDNGGPLGRYLLLAIAVEKGHVQNVARLAGQLGHTLGAVEAASIEALAWAEEAAGST